MDYRENQPGEPLGRYVECVWLIQTGRGASPVRRIVPDGTMEIILHAGEPFAQMDDGVPWRQSRALLCGQLTQPIFLAPPARGRTFGVRLHPCAAALLLGIAPAALTDRQLPLADISPRMAARLLDAVTIVDDKKAVASLMKTLGLLVRDHVAKDPVRFAIDRIRQARGRLAIDRLATECSLSPRQLQRLFRERVGISPKLFGRIHRFQNVLQRLEAEEPCWADAALACGYYDQSHLVRDFRQFAGETPSFLLSPQTDLAEEFTWRRRGFHGAAHVAFFQDTLDGNPRS